MKCEWENCGKDFADLNLHLVTHLDEVKVFKCCWKTCEMKEHVFYSKGNLTEHLISCHASEENKMYCIDCEQPFNNIEEMGKHYDFHRQLTDDDLPLAQRIFYEDELRRCDNMKLVELFEDRKRASNLLRILKDELLRNKSKDTDWRK